MKKIIYEQIEVDVSHLSSSDIFKLVEDIGRYCRYVYAEGDEVRVSCLKKLEDARVHMKYYTQATVDKWATNGYVRVTLPATTHMISQSQNDNPLPIPALTDGLPIGDERLRGLIMKPIKKPDIGVFCSLSPDKAILLLNFLQPTSHNCQAIDIVLRLSDPQVSQLLRLARYERVKKYLARRKGRGEDWI